MKLLILGGTSEARRLIERVHGDARFDITVSLAGRTKSPISLPVETRVGGFGGVSGLKHYISDHRIDVIVDATHPFAGQISAHAVEAARACGVPMGSVVRPPWTAQPGEDWIDVDSGAATAEALPEKPSRVFLSLGRLELRAFAARSEHTYLARTIDPPGDIALPPDITFVFDRGPFDLASEVALLKQHRIELIVSKNSGGEATYAKIEAARNIGIPVVMVRRPKKPVGVALFNIEEAVAWLDDVASTHARPLSERGV